MTSKSSTNRDRSPIASPTSRRALLGTLSLALVAVPAIATAPNWMAAMRHFDCAGEPAVLHRTRAGRSLSRARYHNAEQFFASIESGIMDRHGAYVGLSRHRDGVQLHYGRDDFKNEARLVRVLARERIKEMASDYERRDPAQIFAERRGITLRKRVSEIIHKVPEKARGMFDGLRLSIGGQDRAAAATPDRSGSIPLTPLRGAFADFRPPDPVKAVQAERDPIAVECHARAIADVSRMQNKGLPILPHQTAELVKAREALNAAGKHAAADMEAAYSRNPALVSEAAAGRTRQAIRAMELEAEVRTDPRLRADRFVEGWRQLSLHREDLQRDGDFRGARKVSEQMASMAKSLERDAQVESLLRPRRQDLGIDIDTGRKLAHDLTASVGIEMGRSQGLNC